VDSSYLVGAYGMFWERDHVNWNPGSGNHAWQLLGRTNTNRPALTVCDFRKAHGFYVLFDDYRATYVGLARGAGGIGSRLQQHVSDGSKYWSRFSWFSLDQVKPDKDDGWSTVHPRGTLGNMPSELILRECEALLITILGTTHQNKMRFQEAKCWQQLREGDFLPGGIARKVSSEGFTDPWQRSLLAAPE
jgi:hypothetical protein